jgi:hypothetical protein
MDLGAPNPMIGILTRRGKDPERPVKKNNMKGRGRAGKCVATSQGEQAEQLNRDKGFSQNLWQSWSC